MDHFGLRSMDDLPQLKEFQLTAEEIGEPAPLEEFVGIDPAGNGESYSAMRDEESE